MGTENVEVTEIEELDVTKASAVPKNANGTPWLLVKNADMISTEGETASPKPDGSEDEGAVKDPESGVPVVPTSSDKTPDMDNPDVTALLMSKATNELALYNDYVKRGIVSSTDLSHIQQGIETTYPASIIQKAKLNAKARNALANSKFAYIDSKGGRHLPIEDASHVRNALARFNQTEFESASAKKVARRKILAAAKKFDIETNPDDKVNKGIIAKHDIVIKSPGIPKESLTHPETIAVIPSGQSSFHPSLTPTLATLPASDSDFKGGASTYVIPLEAKVPNGDPLSNKKKAKIIKGKFASLASHPSSSFPITISTAFDKDSSADYSGTPGNSVWEHFDAANLDSVARGLASAIKVTQAIRNRETIEAISGHQNDWMDAYKLECALDDLTSALSLIAALAYHEAAASHQTESIVKALSPFLPKENTTMPTVVSQNEYKKMLNKDAKKLAKSLTQKALKKQLKEITTILAKNANNGGDVTTAQVLGSVGNHYAAGDINIPGATQSLQGNEGVKKSDKSSLKKKVARLEKTLNQIGNTPVSGGPVLDGISRGSFFMETSANQAPAAFMPDNDNVGAFAKGITPDPDPAELQAKIVSLRKQLDAAQDPREKESLGRALTKLNLEYGVVAGLLPRPQFRS